MYYNNKWIDIANESYFVPIRRWNCDLLMIIHQGTKFPFFVRRVLCPAIYVGHYGTYFCSFEECEQIGESSFKFFEP